MTYTTFSEFLKSKYLERKERNPKYSLRSFSRDLEMSSGRLTNLLKDRDIPGAETIEKISLLLKVEAEEKDNLIKLISTQKYLKRGAGFSRQLSNEEFKEISDWKSWSIFTLFQCSEMVPRTTWFIEKTGFTREEVEECFQKLKKIGLIETSEDFYVLKFTNVTTTTDLPSHEIRRFHKEFIEFGVRSLDEVAVELRDFSSLTMCIDKENISEYKKVIGDFRAKINQISSKTGNSKDLYQLNIQFFPINLRSKK